MEGSRGSRFHDTTIRVAGDGCTRIFVKANTGVRGADVAVADGFTGRGRPSCEPERVDGDVEEVGMKTLASKG